MCFWIQFQTSSSGITLKNMNLIWIKETVKFMDDIKLPFLFSKTSNSQRLVRQYRFVQWKSRFLGLVSQWLQKCRLIQQVILTFASLQTDIASDMWYVKVLLIVQV